jgi:sugar diacid utilization regulator
VVLLDDPDARARPVDKEALRVAAVILAVELVALRTRAKSNPSVLGEVLDELLVGRDPMAAVTRARLFGYEIDGDVRVVVVERDRQVPGEEFSLFPSVRRWAESLAIGSVFTILSGMVVFLAGPAGDWEAFRSAVAADLAGVDCRVGVGACCHDARDLSVSYQQAQLALSFQRSLATSERVTWFEHLGVYRVLAEVGRTMTVEHYVDEWLGPLIDYDARRRAELVATLAAYLEHGGSHVASANALSVHRSTLRYRLERIRAILGRDLSDADVRFNLQLATRAWTTLQALRQTAAAAPEP